MFEYVDIFKYGDLQMHWLGPDVSDVHDFENFIWGKSLTVPTNLQLFPAFDLEKKI